MELCGNAQLVVLPKGARHMADPSKLVAGAEEFSRLYSEITPID